MPLLFIFSFLGWGIRVHHFKQYCKNLLKKKTKQKKNKKQNKKTKKKKGNIVII